MKKNLLMIYLISTLLVGVLLVMNRVSANGNANITLSITAGSFSCSGYPTAVAFGNTAASSSATNMTTDSWTNQFTGCIDLMTGWTTQMTAQSTALTGGSNTIAASNITWTPAGSIVTLNGDCGGISLGGGGTLGVSRTIIQKSGVKTCKFSYTPDGMSVNVPAYTPLASYTAVMTITDPS